MRPNVRTAATDARTCHWSYVTRRTPTGRQTSARVWICEYPYRTMRTSPCVDCDACVTVRHIASALDDRSTADN
jgi:hypothetical protein